MIKVYKAFPGGKHKVLTFSYDDGKFDDRRLVSIFNQYGMKATFNLNSGLINDGKRIDPSEWTTLYKGHEVAVHTVNHPTIDRCPNTQIVSEVLDDRKYLENIMGYPIRGLAYPNGSYSPRVEQILSDLDIKYARIVGDEYSNSIVTSKIQQECGRVVVGDRMGFDFPSNYYEWQPTCHHNHGLIDFGKKFLEHKKKQYLVMMYVWGHSYEFSRDDNWEVMEEFCKMMSNQDDIWYATNIEIVDYMETYERLQFAADLSFVHNPSYNSCWLSINDSNIVEVKGGETLSLKQYDI